MDETSTATPYTLPFSRYTMAQVKAAIADKTLGELHWHTNEDGSPNLSIGRIYISMPNPALDLVVQTDDHSYNAFPAADWLHVDHPAQQAFAAVAKSLDAMNTSLVHSLQRMDDYKPAPSMSSDLLVNTVRNESAFRRYMVKHFTEQLDVLEKYGSNLEPMAQRIEALAPQFTDPKPLLALAQQLRDGVDLLHNAVPNLEAMRKHHASFEAPLAQIAGFLRTHNVGLAEAAMEHLGDHYVGDYYKEHETHLQFNRDLSNMLHGTEQKLNAVETVLGIQEDPVLDALRGVLREPRWNPTPQSKLNRTIDAVAEMKPSEIARQASIKQGEMGPWGERVRKEDGGPDKPKRWR